MKITFFTGAGISKESGISTFRDSDDGLWEKYDIESVASKDGWKLDRETVLEFYNERRNQLNDVEPNDAHKIISDLENDYDITVITQNVDDLHERAGSSKVIHLHGELKKAQSSLDSNLVYDIDSNINIGDKCEKGSQLRPHIVWFGEMPNNVKESYDQIKDTDIFVIVGTSLSITYTLGMLEEVVNRNIPIYYIDPNPSEYLDGITEANYIKEKATTGLKSFKNIL